MNKDSFDIFREAQNGNIEKIKEALINGIDINIVFQQDASKSILHYATHFNHLNLVKLLIERGINVNLEDKYGKTALHYAAKTGPILILKNLIKNGAIIDKKDINKATPFNEAIYNNNMDCAQFLLNNGADINNHYNSNYDNGITSLHFAVAGGYNYSKQLVHFLITNGANPCLEDDNNNLILNTAIEQNTLTNQIIKAVKNINIQDKYGKTVLHYAAANESLTPLKKILKHKDINFNILDNEGKTPLYYSHNETIASILIKNGALYDNTKEYDHLFCKMYGEQHIDLKKLNKLINSNEDETFKLTKLISYATKAINDFAKKHKDETFYIFTIDGALLCLNSEESFKETLEKYQTNYPGLYDSKESIQDLKFNTGDFKYQGFASFGEGFVDHYYNEHYNLSNEEQKNSPYAIAMDTVIKELQNKNVFKSLKLSKHFTAIRAEHTY